MARITLKQQQEIQKYQLLPLQKAMYENLLECQRKYPQLTDKQYKLFQTLFKQIKNNKPNTWLNKTQ